MIVFLLMNLGRYDITDKTKSANFNNSSLAGIEAEANKYVHPEDTNIRHVTDAEKEKWNSNKNLSVQSNGTGNAVTSLSYNSTSGTLIQNKSATFLLQSDAAQQNMPTGTSSNTIVSIAPVTYIRIDNGVSTMIDTSVLQGGQIFAITLIAGGRLGHNIYGERGGMIRLNMVYPEDRFVLAVWDAQKLGLRHLFGTNDVL